MPQNNSQHLQSFQNITKKLNQQLNIENFSQKRNFKNSQQLLEACRKILCKNPEQRTPSQIKTILILSQYNRFFDDLNQNIYTQCMKGILKQVRIKNVYENQLLIQQGAGIRHLIIVLHGKLGICKDENQFKQKSNKSILKKEFIKNKDPHFHRHQAPINFDFSQLTKFSCKYMYNLRMQIPALKKKSTIPPSTDIAFCSTLSQEQCHNYHFQYFINAGQQYGIHPKMNSKTYEYSCVAVENSTIIIIDFNLLFYWLEVSFRMKISELSNKLKKIPLFSFLDHVKLSSCILAMYKQKKKRNDYLYKQGDQSEKLYFLVNGEVKLTKQTKLFEQNPNQLYVDRRKFMQQAQNSRRKTNDNEVKQLQYANLTTIYNYKPKKKNIQIGIITSLKGLSLIGQEQMIQKKQRQTNAFVISLQAELYEIQIKKIQEILGTNLKRQFYNILQEHVKKLILYRQNQYSSKIHFENKKNLEYFYESENKLLNSSRKKVLDKINNQIKQQQNVTIRESSIPKTPVKPFYTTFNFYQLVKTEKKQRQSFNNLKKKQYSSTNQKTKNRSYSSNENQIQKFNPLEQHLIGISHSWKPMKKIIGQQLKVLKMIAPKKHSINLHEPLIQQDYLVFMDKQHKRVQRKNRNLRLSFGQKVK